jgi:hypothetical protein
MIRASKLTVALAVVLVGLWGCSKAPTNRTSEKRLHDLEERCASLERDRAHAVKDRDAAREQARKLDDDKGLLQKELDARDGLERQLEALRRQVQLRQSERDEVRQQLLTSQGEREELRQQLLLRGGEIDTLKTRCDRLTRGLQGLLTEVSQEGPQGALPASLGAPQQAPAVSTSSGGQ